MLKLTVEQALIRLKDVMAEYGEFDLGHTETGYVMIQQNAEDGGIIEPFGSRCWTANEIFSFMYMAPYVVEMIRKDNQSPLRHLKGIIEGMVESQRELRNKAATGSIEYLDATAKLDALWAVLGQVRLMVTGSTGGEYPKGWDSV